MSAIRAPTPQKLDDFPELYDYGKYKFPRYYRRFNRTHFPRIDHNINDDLFSGFCLPEIQNFRRPFARRDVSENTHQSITGEKVNSISTCCFKSFNRKKRKNREETTPEESHVDYTRVRLRDTFCNPSNRLNKVTFLYCLSLEWFYANTRMRSCLTHDGMTEEEKEKSRQEVSLLFQEDVKNKRRKITLSYERKKREIYDPSSYEPRKKRCAIENGSVVAEVKPKTMPKILGEGTYGKVLEGKIDDSRRPCALKISARPSNVANYIEALRERCILSKLQDSPHVVKVKAFITKGPFQSCLVMEKGGLNLDHYIETKNLRLLTKVRFMKQLIDIYEFFKESGILYTDLKPANLLVDPRTYRLTVVDYNYIRVIPPNGSTKARHDNVQTIIYRHFLDHIGAPLDFRILLWAITIIFYEIVTKDCCLFPFEKCNDDETIIVLQIMETMFGGRQVDWLKQGKLTDQFYDKVGDTYISKNELPLHLHYPTPQSIKISYVIRRIRGTVQYRYKYYDENPPIIPQMNNVANLICDMLSVDPPSSGQIKQRLTDIENAL